MVYIPKHFLTCVRHVFTMVTKVFVNQLHSLCLQLLRPPTTTNISRVSMQNWETPCTDSFPPHFELPSWPWCGENSGKYAANGHRWGPSRKSVVLPFKQSCVPIATCSFTHSRSLSWLLRSSLRLSFFFKSSWIHTSITSELIKVPNLSSQNCRLISNATVSYHSNPK
jgi:hypothetical protein